MIFVQSQKCVSRNTGRVGMSNSLCMHNMVQYRDLEQKEGVVKKGGLKILLQFTILFCTECVSSHFSYTKFAVEKFRRRKKISMIGLAKCWIYKKFPNQRTFFEKKTSYNFSRQEKKQLKKTTTTSRVWGAWCGPHHRLCAIWILWWLMYSKTTNRSEAMANLIG